MTKSRTRPVDRLPLAERRRQCFRAQAVYNTAAWRWDTSRMGHDGYDLKFTNRRSLWAYHDVFSGDHDLTYCKVLGRRTENWPDVPVLRPKYANETSDPAESLFTGPGPSGEWDYACPFSTFHDEIPLWRLVSVPTTKRINHPDKT